MRIFLWTLALISSFALCRGAAPTLDWIFPAGGQTNTTNRVTSSSKTDAWPVQVWADDPGIVFKPAEKNLLDVSIAPGTSLGPHLIRFYNQEGASKPHIWMVGKAISLAEKEPNDGPQIAQQITNLPAILEGRFDKSGDSDWYVLNLKSNSWLVASVNAYGIGSPVDPLLHLFDTNRIELAFSHDTQNLDPLLSCRIPRDGAYFLMVAAFGHPPEANVQFTGSAACIYRLNSTDGPFAHYAFPAGIAKGRKSSVSIHAWNHPTIEAVLECGTNATTEWSEPRFLNTLHLEAGDHSEVLEVEPNNQTNTAQSVTIPCIINGRLDPRGDLDQFSFQTKKGDRLLLHLRSASLGFLVDGRIKIRDATGAQLAQNDDNAADRDPKIEWTAPADGRFFLELSDIFHKGGEDYIYRLEIRPPVSDFRAATETDSINLTAGGSAEIKGTIQRLEGSSEKLVISIPNLPSGVKFDPTEIPEKARDFTLKILAAETVKPTNTPISIILTSEKKTHGVTYSLRGQLTGGPLQIDSTDKLWLTIRSK